MIDYYAILDIPPDAPADKVREQYRFLVHAWHPDKFPNPAQKLRAEEKIKSINEAYAVLNDPLERRRYNRQRFNRHRGWQPDESAAEPPSQPPAPPMRTPRTLADTNAQLGTGATIIYLLIAGALIYVLRVIVLRNVLLLLAVLLLAFLITIPFVYWLDDYLRKQNGV
jgi:hypothetical protein